MSAGAADDYYGLLGVEEGADLAAVRRAWRRLAQRWHPDRAGPETTAIFQRLAAAYAVLSDPIARAAYDRRRGTSARSAVRSAGAAAGAGASADAATSAGTSAGAAAGAPGRRAPGVLLIRLSRPLDVLLACRVARRAEDGVIELFLEPEEAEEGGMVTISMRVPVRCPACGGGGGDAETCAGCGARGTVDDLFSAWLAVRPGTADGAILKPSAQLPGVIRPVSFRIRIGHAISI